MYLNFRFRYVRGSFGLSYLPLLPTAKAPGTEGSLAPLLASCSDANIVGWYARIGPHTRVKRGSSQSNAPSSGRPRRNSRAGSRRPPGVCSSSTSRDPDPQETTIRPLSVRM
jgi:hypothetical protein